MPLDDFAAVNEAGRAAVLHGTHRREESPARTGRWGPSIVVRPSGEVGAALARVTDEVSQVVGQHHWRSGGLGRAHVTVRALERYTALLADDRAERYADAARRAASGLGSVGFAFGGLALSVGSVMVRAAPIDMRANHLRRRLAEELGDDGWLERRAFPNGRDPIWYCSIVHFAGPILAPERLIEWVDARSEVALGQEVFNGFDLCTWGFDGSAMAPRVVRSISPT